MKSLSSAVPHFAVVMVLTGMASPALALDAALPPSGNFDLTHWKLTLPIGDDEDPEEILPAQLSQGHVSAPYFFTSPTDGALRFWAPVTGVTTGGSSYPRSELREQLHPGKNAPNWMADGTHVLDAECRIVQVPSTGRVIIGQIHGKSAPGGAAANPLVKLAYDRDTSSLRIQVKHSPHRSVTSESTDVVPGIKVGSLIKYQIKVVDGVAKVTVNGTTHARDFYATDADWSETDLYFKAGAYAIDNAGSDSEGAKVDFYALSVRHPPASESAPAPATTSPSAPPTANAGDFLMRANEVVMEAEHASLRTSRGTKSWRDLTEAPASGGATTNAIQVLFNTGELARSPGDAACRADYLFVVPAGSAGSSRPPAW